MQKRVFEDFLKNSLSLTVGKVDREIARLRTGGQVACGHQADVEGLCHDADTRPSFAKPFGRDRSASSSVWATTTGRNGHRRAPRSQYSHITITSLMTSECPMSFRTSTHDIRTACAKGSLRTACVCMDVRAGGRAGARACVHARLGTDRHENVSLLRAAYLPRWGSCKFCVPVSRLLKRVRINDCAATEPGC